MIVSNKRKIGESEETRAVAYFNALGWKLFSRNYQCRLGEIDLIFRDPKGAVVFVEVKFRSDLEYGPGQAAVGSTKQKRMIKTALFFIKQKRLQGSDFRFDVCALTPDKIDHIENAFFARGYTL